MAVGLGNKLINWNKKLLQFNGKPIRVGALFPPLAVGYPTDGLISRWALQSNLGDNISGYDMEVMTGSATYSSGNNGNAIDMDGTNTFKAPDPSIWNTVFGDVSAWSISIWTNITSTINGIDVVGVFPNDTPVNIDERTTLTADDTFGAYNLGRYNPSVIGDAAQWRYNPFPSSWTHQVVTYDGNNLNMYIDSSAMAQDTGNTTSMDEVYTLVGLGLGPVTPMSGQAQFLYVYDRALAQVDVDKLYASGAGV